MLVLGASPRALAILTATYKFTLMLSPRNSLRALALAVVVALFDVPVARAADGPVVALPPFLVEEAAERVPWLYADVGGFEVLACTPERFTRELIAHHYRLHALLDEMVPDSLRMKLSTKPALLFYDAARQPAGSAEVIGQLALTSASAERREDTAQPLVDDGRLRRRPATPRYTFMPNLRLWDRDGTVLFAMVQEREFDGARLALTLDHLAYVLQTRLPALPPWYVSGALALFSQARFTNDALVFERLPGLPQTDAAALLRGTAPAPKLMPLREFFMGNVAAGEAQELWQAQAALFVHWGLGGRGAPRRAALWKFVERTATELPTEALFRECFGMDFAAAQRQLTAYLPEATEGRLTLRAARAPRPPEYTLRKATEVEVARIKGDWERLEVGFVKNQYPAAVAERYREQARRTLLRAYEADSRDPHLLAELGLVEAEAGADAAARRYLEEAVVASQSSVALRPRAWYELARLRYAEARAKLPDAEALLSREQTEAVTGALASAYVQEPPLAEVYELLAEVWARSAVVPQRPELDRIFDRVEQGARYFPTRTELLYNAAKFSVRHGRTESAAWLIDLGRRFTPDEAARARFDALRAPAGK